MKRVYIVLLTLVALLAGRPAQAQVLTNTWSYSGGGLAPGTYEALGDPGKYKPATLVPDAAASNGATIDLTGLTSGGLGSSTSPDGYGGLYTFFSSTVSLNLQTSIVLAGVQTITVSFLEGGGTTYGSSSLSLNYNLSHSAVTSSSFTAISAGPVDTPIGPVTMTTYTWTWDVSSLGSSSAFSVNWLADQQHTFFDNMNVVQTVPEPSTCALLGLSGVGVLWMHRRHTRKKAVL